jgi:diaminopimelate epimerase
LIKFWKMHGLGNDYVVIDNRDRIIKEDEISVLARRICQRRFSIGADGIILLSISQRADVGMRIFNADGSEAEMCGNGIRCLAKYCYDNRIVEKDKFTVETLAGMKAVRLTVEDSVVKNVRVDMGKPIFERQAIPMRGEGKCVDELLNIDGREFKVTCLSVGNPHCVIFVDDVDNFPVGEVGSRIESDELFPKRVNVEFAQILNRKLIHARIWERGVGETFACGTGACAAVVAANVIGKCNSEVVVNLFGGDLTVKYNDEIFMTGPAEKAFEGIISLR